MDMGQPSKAWFQTENAHGTGSAPALFSEGSGQRRAALVDKHSDAKRTDGIEVPPARPPMNPGDEARSGSPQTAEQLCPDCGGTGQRNAAPCSTCGGSGRVVGIVGDA